MTIAQGCKYAENPLGRTQPSETWFSPAVADDQDTQGKHQRTGTGNVGTVDTLKTKRQQHRAIDPKLSLPAPLAVKPMGMSLTMVY